MSARLSRRLARLEARTAPETLVPFTILVPVDNDGSLSPVVRATIGVRLYKRAGDETTEDFIDRMAGTAILSNQDLNLLLTDDDVADPPYAPDDLLLS